MFLCLFNVRWESAANGFSRLQVGSELRSFDNPFSTRFDLLVLGVLCFKATASSFDEDRFGAILASCAFQQQINDFRVDIGRSLSCHSSALSVA